MLKLSEVNRSFGHIQALEAFSMEVPDGAIYGLIGPSGAGKSTALRILAGLMYPDSGTAMVDDMEAGRSVRRLRKRIGYVPEEFGIYRNMTVGEYMSFFAQCYDLYGARTHRRIQLVLDMVGLSDRESMYVEALSRNALKRLSLARALIHDPKYLIMDEPASGTDPAARYMFRQVFSELSDDGKTILFSSHVMNELTDLCTHIGILDHGRMLMDGEKEAVLREANAGSPVVIAVEQKISETMRMLREDSKVRSISIRGQELYVGYDGGSREEAALLSRLVNADIPVRAFYRKQGSLEALVQQMSSAREERKVTGYEAEDESGFS